MEPQAGSRQAPSQYQRPAAPPRRPLIISSKVMRRPNVREILDSAGLFRPRDRPRTALRRNPSRWPGAWRTRQRRRSAVALHLWHSFPICQPGRSWLARSGRLFARAGRRPPIAGPGANPFTRWLAIPVLGHSAGGTGALQDAGALYEPPLSHVALRRVGVAEAAVRFGAYGEVTVGSKSRLSGRGRPRTGYALPNRSPALRHLRNSPCTRPAAI